MFLHKKGNKEKVRVAVMWTQLSGYLNACLKELAKDHNVELFVSHEIPSSDAPYDPDLFSWIVERYEWKNHPDKVELLKRMEIFSPDVILSSGWNVKQHRVVLKKFKNRSTRLISVDNQWVGSFKQYLGLIVSKFYLHPICDGLFVAGERQAIFAKKLGFDQRKILRGVLTCDFDKFSEIFHRRQKLSSEPKAFIYVGRLSEEKGIDLLAKAYLEYRENVSNPWPLICCGAGPKENVLKSIKGVELKGFVQPTQLPDEFLSASCLVLPSKFEPWALVVHEAVTAGLGVVCTEAVGASVHLVQKNHNGYVVGNDSVNELAEAMKMYSMMSDEERRQVSYKSHQMSLQFTPARWVKTLIGSISLI